ncbi:hypothetical protein AVEN_172535-1 [Araneus ventricosus]|uniref:Uncharacterized protein n=1 Tax=Araneus ventricosus TaxID=182803 RepID=A0A4Y2K3N0_ARAVE|nr:hypothetical protein AVEN_172535-1 [Araneus ventricosus]
MTVADSSGAETGVLVANHLATGRSLPKEERTITGGNFNRKRQNMKTLQTLEPKTESQRKETRNSRISRNPRNAQIPGIPQIYGMPAIPRMPQIPGTPQIHGMPQIPGIPQIPCIP